MRDCENVRVILFSPQASLDQLGNGRSPFRRCEAKQTCPVPHAGGSVHKDSLVGILAKRLNNTTRHLFLGSLPGARLPASVYGANKLGLDRRGLSADDVKELEAAFRLLTRSKLNTTQALEAIEAKGFRSPHVKALVDFIRNSKRGVAK